MIVETLGGKKIKLSLVSNPREDCSELHIKARHVIGACLGLYTIIEELHVPSIGYFDFFIPRRKVFVECQGRQHYEFNHLFYKNYLDFIDAQNRDKLKQEWCKLNKLSLVEFRYDEDIETWKQKLLGTI